MDSKTNSHTGSQLGAIPVSDTQSQFRVWAPSAKSLSLQLVTLTDGKESVVSTHELTRDSDGFYQGLVDDCPAGTLYRFRIDSQQSRPDPRSRFQPHGVHGPSQVVDPNSFQWSDQAFKGVNKRDLVIYEMHVGSFTENGTYLSAIEHLDELKAFGITAIEVLPLAQCPGKWNWGYDGVNYFAPNHTYGTTDELKAFVNACHARDMAVINDVVYNHVGPEGNYLSEFGGYRSKKYGTPWGDAFDFDLHAVRQFVIDNVLFWIDEFHFDGLRLDAVHYMFDDKQPHILEEIRLRVDEYRKTVDRTLHLIGESNIYDPELVGEKCDGQSYDAIWSDCLMHSIYKAGAPELRLTNRHYQENDISETMQHAYVFSAPKAIRADAAIRARNHPTGSNDYIESLVMALQTHDSVGNHPHGKRLHQLTSVEHQMAAAPLILLYPSIPMIFMGEEWATEAPFPFFADFEDAGLRKAVDKGRRDEYPHHDWTGSPLPSDPAAFLNSKSKPDQKKQEVHDWYRQLLAFRKSGIENGWLHRDYFSTSSHLETGIHQLIYKHPKGEIHVCSRLARNGEAIELSSIDAGEILFSSRNDVEKGKLAPEHCVIWKKTN